MKTDIDHVNEDSNLPTMRCELGQRRKAARSIYVGFFVVVPAVERVCADGARQETILPLLASGLVSVISFLYHTISIDSQQ